MNGTAVRFRALPYLLAFFTSLCIMILELVASRLVARHVGGVAECLDERDRDHAGRDLPGERPRRPTRRPGRPGAGGRPALRPRGGPHPGLPLVQRPGRPDPRDRPAGLVADRPGRVDRLPDSRDGARDDRPGGRQDRGRAGAADRLGHRRRLHPRRGRLDRRDVPGRLLPHVPRPDHHHRDPGGGSIGFDQRLPGAECARVDPRPARELGLAPRVDPPRGRPDPAGRSDGRRHRVQPGGAAGSRAGPRFRCVRGRPVDPGAGADRTPLQPTGHRRAGDGRADPVDRPRGALVRHQPGVHGVRDGRRAPGLAAPGIEHLRLDQHHRRPAGRAQPGQLPRRQAGRLLQERGAGELAVRHRLVPDPDRPAARIAPPAGWCPTRSAPTCATNPARP